MAVNSNKSKWPVWRIVILSILVVGALAAYLFYRNFNKLLANALHNSFESSLVADVYELSFDDLLVNVADGSIRVNNVVLQPRQQPKVVYPYINSTIVLKTHRLVLENVDIRTLLRDDRLVLDKIWIDKPDVKLVLNGARSILLPFNDSIAVSKPVAAKKHPAISSYVLKEFSLVEADFHVTNNFKMREFSIDNFGISLYNLFVEQQPKQYKTSFSQVDLSIGQFVADMQNEVIKTVAFKDFKIGIDSLDFVFTLDTMLYRFSDFHAGMRELGVLTKDSLFNAAMHSFDLSYRQKSIQIRDINFNPNVAHSVLQKMHKYQHTEFSGSVGSIDLNGVDFNGLLYGQKVVVDELLIDKVNAFIYKDNTKSLDQDKFPKYLGQTIAAIPVPISVKHMALTNVALENTERKPDGHLAKATIGRASVEVDNFTNMSADKGLSLKASGYVLDKIHFEAALLFDYQKPQFNFEGKLGRFDLTMMNPLIQAYTPAKIKNGTADEISFKGTAFHANAKGQLTFLYHDLKVDLDLKDKANWKNTVLAITANTVLDSNNPSTEKHPARVVNFDVERNQNKGFVNIIIKSILAGFKETMVMSNENRKDYQRAKKDKLKEDK